MAIVAAQAEQALAGGYDAALSSFFNALIREFDTWRFVCDGDGAAFEFALCDGRILQVRCTHFSRSGRHGLLAPCRLADSHGRSVPLPFAQAAALALEAVAADSDPTGLMTRVRDSAANMHAILSARAPDLPRLFSAELSFIDAETALLTGHSVHPCPKARDHFSDADAQAYAPEFIGEFPLLWIVVAREHLALFAAPDIHHDAVITQLAQSDSRLAGWMATLDAGYCLLPCHPSQWRHWQAHPVLARRLESGEMTLLGESSLRWQATSSLRSIYSTQAPWMAKFSLSVKLTNSLRHLQPEELIRGAQLAEVLGSSAGRAFLARFPQMHVLSEPVAVCLRDDEGLPLPETAVLWRENPFTGAAAQRTEVLATLLQDDPRDGVPRLVKRLRAAGCLDAASVRDWFGQFLQVVVRPLLFAQADYGLLFGAHQQNIVIALAQGLWPERLYFRDCQGTGFSELARKRFPGFFATAGEAATLIDEAMTVTLFSYYLFINATFNVISSLAMSGVVAEADLLAQLRAFLQARLGEGVADDSVIQYLLHAPTLNIKGNFHCALTGLNENTHADILSLYRPMPNPLITEDLLATDLLTTELLTTGR